MSSRARQLLVDYYESVEKTLPAMLLPDHTLFNGGGGGGGTKFRSLWLMDENFHFPITTRVFSVVIAPDILFKFFYSLSNLLCLWSLSYLAASIKKFKMLINVLNILVGWEVKSRRRCQRVVFPFEVMTWLTYWCSNTLTRLRYWWIQFTIPSMGSW